MRSNKRLGIRGALEWAIDQFQASEHKRSGITSDPKGGCSERFA